jgi:hypothetical protein
MMSLTAVTPHACQASRPCNSRPCFHIRLDAPVWRRPAHRDAAACPSHLGEVVCGLASWAHEHGLRGGQVTVLAVDTHPAGSPPAGSNPAASGFAFTSIPV